jgi:hypothetical protein
MKVKVLPSAECDLDQGYDFYEKQAEGVGAYFLDSLYSDIDSLIISGGMHSIFFGKYHRMLSKRFPFANGNETAWPFRKEGVPLTDSRRSWVTSGQPSMRFGAGWTGTTGRCNRFSKKLSRRPCLGSGSAPLRPRPQRD